MLGGAPGALGACAASSDPVVSASPPGARWMHHARIVGLDLSGDDGNARRFDDAARAGASVIEGDSVLSDYLTTRRFEEEVRRIELFAKDCHARTLKLVWYYPSLEVVTPNAENPGVRSLYKDHPDWVQISLDRRPNVFYGSKEHWVEPSAESAWLCHNSGYREVFFERVRKLAESGIDGLWIDVPLFMDTVLRWTCLNPACNDKFRADTGLSAEALTEDWEDAAFRAWIVWRHEELARFCMETHAVARAVDPDIEVLFETVTMDTDIATVQALDASFRTFELSKPLPSAAALELAGRVDRVWELDSVSNDFGMRPAVHDDWVCKIRGAKFARGCDRERPSWVFSYGAEEPDAGLVMAILAATGCNPYETKTPNMTTTVGQEFRARMFRFLEAHSELLFEAEPVATVGLLHSSSSRDFLDRGPVDTSFFVSAVNLEENVDVRAADASFFWGASLRSTTYSADYGGAFQALSHLHAPFAIVPIQSLTEADEAYLASFRLLVAPSLECLSDVHARMLARFVESGGHLLLCGPSPGRADHLGAPKPEASRLDRLLGFEAAKGAAIRGPVTYAPERLGARYLGAADASALATFSRAVDAAGARRIAIDARAYPHVHVDLARRPGQVLLHLVSYDGAAPALRVRAGAGRGGYPFEHDYRIVPRTIPVEVTVPEPVRGVRWLSPDRGFVEADARWLGGGKLEVPVQQYTLAVLEV